MSNLLLLSPPSWILKGSAVDADFANGRYWGGYIDSLLSISRASTGTDLRPESTASAAYSTFGANVMRRNTRGLLIEESRTNHLLNSTAPATQTTAALGTGSYTLWVNGSGSATSSAGTATGTGFGAATQGNPNTFTLSAGGTVTVTVTGSLNAFQLEAGGFGTSLIVTAGATAARAADVITVLDVSRFVLPAGPNSFRMEGSWGSAASQSAQFWSLYDAGATAGGANDRVTLFANNTAGSAQFTAMIGGVAQADMGGLGVAAQNETIRFAGRFGVNDFAAISSKGSTVGTDTSGSLPAINAARVGVHINNSGFLNGYLRRATWWKGLALPDATLRALTQ